MLDIPIIFLKELNYIIQRELNLLKAIMGLIYKKRYKNKSIAMKQEYVLKKLQIRKLIKENI